MGEFSQLRGMDISCAIYSGTRTAKDPMGYHSIRVYVFSVTRWAFVPPKIDLGKIQAGIFIGKLIVDDRRRGEAWWRGIRV